MATTTQVQKVKLNKMTKARYEDTTPVATEFYMLTDVLDPQYDVLPTADAKYAGQITQYTGESVDGGYTNGYFYKCTAQGTSPETYAWEQTDVQPSSGGLPDPTGHSGEIITTDGTTSGWGNVVGPLVLHAPAYDTVLTFRSGDGTPGSGTDTIIKVDTVYNGIQLLPSGIFGGGWSFGSQQITPVYGAGLHTIGSFNTSSRLACVYTRTICSATSYAESQTNKIEIPNTGGTMAVSSNDSTATTGQVLTKTSTGAEWADAQGGSGIEWAVKLDLPADYSGDRYSATPYYTINGGLPDGEYEFYFATKETTDRNSPIGEVIFKVLLKIDNEQNTAYGIMGYVFNGDYKNDGNNIFQTQKLWRFVKKNNNDVIFGVATRPWMSSIATYLPQQEIPECFKLSAIKNVNTGETYIATGSLELPESAIVMGGYVSLEAIMPQPEQSTYFYSTDFWFDDNLKYVYVQPMGAITHPGLSQACCSEFEVNMYCGDDRYHATVNNIGDTYVLTVHKADGVFANTQIGYNDQDETYIYINQEDGTTGACFLSFSVKGSVPVLAEGWLETTDSFIPLIPTEVGGQITVYNLGKILQYTKPTTADYTNGYFYKADGTIITIPDTITFTSTDETGATAEVADANALISAIANETGWDTDYIIQELKNDYEWAISYYDNQITEIYWSTGVSFESQDVKDCFVVSGMDNSEYYFNDTYTPGHNEVSNPHWTQINVQPDGGGVSDVKVNGTSVVTSGVADIVCPEIDDTSTTSTSNTWSASKLNTMIGDIETLINAL